MGITESGTFHHACFVVNDIERSARTLAGSLGIGPWGLWTIEPEISVVHGRATPVSFRIALAPVGAANYELIQPLSGESVYLEHLRSRGEGFHHTCIAYETLDAMRNAKRELEGQGRTMIQNGAIPGMAEFCYFEIAETGAVLELLHLKELPPPEMEIG